MNDAQIWTMIGAFTALFFGMMTVVSTLFIRVVRTEVGGLRGEMIARFGGVSAEVGGLRSEMNTQIDGLRSEMNAQIGGLRGEMQAQRNEMNARFDAVNTRIDGLDRDVQAIVKRTFGLDRD